MATVADRYRTRFNRNTLVDPTWAGGKFGAPGIGGEDVLYSLLGGGLGVGGRLLGGLGRGGQQLAATGQQLATTGQRAMQLAPQVSSRIASAARTPTGAGLTQYVNMNLENPELQRGSFDLSKIPLKEQQPLLWRSPLEQALSGAQGRGDAGQYISALGDVKGATAEAKMSGLYDYLETKPKHTREDLLNFPRLSLTETVKGGLGKPAGEIREVDAAEATQLFNDNVPIHWWDKEFNMAFAVDDLAVLSPENYFAQRPSRYVIRTGGVDIDGTVDANYVNPSLYSETKYGSSKQLNLPGGANPKEILVQLPEREQSPYQLTHNSTNQVIQDFPNRDAAFEALQKIIARGDGLEYSIQPTRPAPDYTDDPHWKEPNILVHVRTNERYVGGKKALHGEEIQSGWHQAGQKKGYQGDFSNLRAEILEAAEKHHYVALGNVKMSEVESAIRQLERNPLVLENPDAESSWSLLRELTGDSDIDLNRFHDIHDTGVPDAPYKKDWHELGFKRLFAEAIKDPSIERLTWTTGEVQADRYNLAKYIDRIEVAREKLYDIEGYAAPEFGLFHTGGNLDGQLFAGGWPTREAAEASVYRQGGEGANLEVRELNPEEVVYELAISHKDGHIQHETNISPEDLEAFVGKEMADKIIAGGGEKGELVINRDSQYALDEVVNLWNQAATTEGDLELNLANDYDAYQALSNSFPELMEQDNWAEIVVNDVFGGGTKPLDSVYEGLDLEIGGEFHKQLYNQKITKFAKEWLKKFKVKPQRFDESDSAEVKGLREELKAVSKNFPDMSPEELIRASEIREAIENRSGNNKYWYIDITPKMREYFFKHGIPLAEVDQLQQVYA